MLKNHDTLGARLVECRNRLGLRVSRVAALTNIDRKVIGQYERGLRWPSLMMLARLAKIYGVHVCDVLEGLEIPTEKRRSKTKK